MSNHEIIHHVLAAGLLVLAWLAVPYRMTATPSMARTLNIIVVSLAAVSVACVAGAVLLEVLP